jgi:hypothetical protein|tara:strand:- start:386 stop:673 length:288 start_codon:yes stop_codon:yes gene_type:complete
MYGVNSWDTYGTRLAFNADEESEDTDDSQEDIEETTQSKPVIATKSNNMLGYAVLGGIGVMAFGYLYFMISNPQAYVQATAIRTGGNLLGQALSS